MTTVKVHSKEASKHQQLIEAREHKFISDISPEQGGEDIGPNPHELFLGALGSCTAITLQMFAKKRGMDLKNVSVDLSEERIDDPNGSGKKISRIKRTLHLEGNLSAEDRETLKSIADKCPIHKLLVEPKEVITNLDNNGN